MTRTITSDGVVWMSQWSIFQTDIFPMKTCQVKGDRWSQRELEFYLNSCIFLYSLMLTSISLAHFFFSSGPNHFSHCSLSSDFIPEISLCNWRFMVKLNLFWNLTFRQFYYLSHTLWRLEDLYLLTWHAKLSWPWLKQCGGLKTLNHFFSLPMTCSCSFHF